MRFVKRVLPSGRVEFTRTFYVTVLAIAVGIVAWLLLEAAVVIERLR